MLNEAVSFRDMSSTRTIIHGLWYANLGIQVLLALCVIVRKLWRKYPGFSTYVLYNASTSILKYAVSGNAKLYFYIYWICETVGIVLGLLVVREIFMHLFAPHLALRKLATLIFQIAVFILVILGCVVFYVQAPGAQGFPNAILVGEEATRIVEVGLIMFLFLSSSAFGLHWRQNLFGIALGLGIFTTVELVAVAIRLHVGPSAFPAFALTRIVAFQLSLLVWLGYLLIPERVTSSSEVPKHTQLEQWNEAIMELISQ